MTPPMCVLFPPQDMELPQSPPAHSPADGGTPPQPPAPPSPAPPPPAPPPAGGDEEGEWGVGGEWGTEDAWEALPSQRGETPPRPPPARTDPP